ncbi:MAG: RNA polymerase sigma factor [Phycisphaerae bacterium]
MSSTSPSPVGGEDGSELIRRAVAGDSVALKVLLVQSRNRLRKQIAQRVPADLERVFDVDDILQETHVEVFQRIRSFEYRGPGSFENWMTAIAVSRLTNAINHHRAAKRCGGVHGPMNKRIEDSTIALLDMIAGPGRTPSESMARDEAIQAVQSMLEEIPEHYRMAVRLVYLDGLSAKDVAATMNRTERAVHGLCRRGLKALRNRLDGDTCFLSTW